MPSNPFESPPPFRLKIKGKTVFLVTSFLLNLFIVLKFSVPHAPPYLVSRSVLSPTTRLHLVFAIASSSQSWRRRHPYVRLWYSSNSTRAFGFLDRPVPYPSQSDASLPPVVISEDTSRFPYTFRGGLRSAIRVARAVKEVVDRNESDVRWFVFGDDDTVFFVDNLVKTLSKYDHDKWYYIGSNSESYEQNNRFSFRMAFGGGGFAISHSLASVVARVLDSCLRRYGHLYGSDSRIFACLAELGVELTHEPGFHQLDMRGNIFGMLAAHPISPVVSLHHLETVDPIFPDMNRIQAMQHLFTAVNADPARTLQQTVCYDQSRLLTVSVSWGFAVQLFEGNELLPDLLSLYRTFGPWIRGTRVDPNHFMFNLRDYPRHPCKIPLIFFMESITHEEDGIWSSYTRYAEGHCLKSNAAKNIKQIRAFSRKLELDIGEMKAPRRQCCNILPSYNESMTMHIRPCRTDELISMKF